MKVPMGVLLASCLASTASAQRSLPVPLPDPLLDAGVDPACVRASLGKGIAEQAALLNISNDSSAVLWLSSMKVSHIPPATIRAVFCGELRVGDQGVLAYVAWGRPARTTTTATATGTKKVLYYRDGSSVEIVDDVIYSLTETQ